MRHMLCTPQVGGLHRYRDLHSCVLGGLGDSFRFAGETGPKQMRRQTVLYQVCVIGRSEGGDRVVTVWLLKTAFSMVMPSASWVCAYSEDMWRPPLAPVPTLLSPFLPTYHLFLPEITCLPFQTEARAWVWCMVLIQFSSVHVGSAAMFWLEFSHIQCEWAYRIL